MPPHAGPLGRLNIPYDPVQYKDFLEWLYNKHKLQHLKSQLLQFLALAQPTGLSIPMWQWILLRSCGRLVCRSAGSLILDLSCLSPWGLWGLTASFKTVPAPLPQLLGLSAPFWIDPLTFCCHTMPIHDFDDCSAFHTFGLGVLHLL